MLEPNITKWDIIACVIWGLLLYNAALTLGKLFYWGVVRPVALHFWNYLITTQ